jgi:hypothetical protein
MSYLTRYKGIFLKQLHNLHESSRMETRALLFVQEGEFLTYSSITGHQLSEIIKVKRAKIHNAAVVRY